MVSLGYNLVEKLLRIEERGLEVFPMRWRFCLVLMPSPIRFRFFHQVRASLLSILDTE
jgi:hypothetical protein